MAIKYMDYTSVSVKKRKVQGHRVLLSLRDALRNPVLTQQQIADVQVEIDNVNAWIGGTKPTNSPNVPEHPSG